MPSQRKLINWESAEVLNRIYDLAKQEYTQEEIAESLGCGYSTFRRYLSNDEQIKAAYKNGQKFAPLNMMPVVESSLKRMIEGFEYTETKMIRKKVGKDKDGKPIFETDRQEIVKKHKLPDIAAIIFYLKTKGKYIEEQLLKKDDDTLEIIRRVINSKSDLKIAEVEKQKVA